ncbi:cupredoxin domain-containing protein [Marinobacterium arenosum]|uniref:cupredoxin domain-containing protein n=1 Tax=Marinobacterium arenosum TaxID=2862496 RepID=UPI001C94BDA0|nr:cupredoxin family protein [Marinobacterium arenosum]MBY4677586.1 cupredoxin family protein [Marinobacterium arenosum]
MNKVTPFALAALILGAPAVAGSSAGHGMDNGHNGHNGHGSMAHHPEMPDGAHPGRGHIGSAAGHPGRLADIDRTLQVSADDSMRFSPDSWRINAGETIRFIVTNNGRLRHEFAIGDSDEMRRHAQMMREMPDMAHDEGNAVSMAPGETQQLIWTFSRPGTFEAACNLPGHYEAGMKATLDVR